MNNIIIKAASSDRNAYPVVPDPDNPIILQIDGRLMLPNDNDEILHCRFVKLLSEEEEALHQYVLIRQKQAIRSLRASAPSTVY